ncbi:hypothetical protein GDO78_013189 [Eleutherodactylus coqui]|uniref:Uncharacterized protein n=1 Tax=Eleutherodactylus coqui TaxID=57060 RepID=A0A8J6EZV5_ELECQ|nr:hypothetical protein GDO78_013189 [Eleutherodactylus coqui]
MDRSVSQSSPGQHMRSLIRSFTASLRLSLISNRKCYNGFYTSNSCEKWKCLKDYGTADRFQKETMGKDLLNKMWQFRHKLRQIIKFTAGLLTSTYNN